ncbi:MAG: TetR/AcrR family transcriptional regulator [Clostridiales bacterium]|nr:TetR/AcrR family transcriptional regulator [Clostridiales bacterium]
MGHYENGIFTRKEIIKVCKWLFYEQGYHETSYSDICRLAHVNRGTLYYHFSSKEDMRYEVQWEYIIGFKNIAQRYCIEPQYQYLLAMCIFWKKIHEDEKLRRFQLQICMDYPVYTGKKDMTYFYYTIYEAMWGAFWEKKNISQLAFSSAYGFVTGCLRMMCEYPEKYDPVDMFMHCVGSSAAIWGIPEEKISKIWPHIRSCMEKIPEEEMYINFVDGREDEAPVKTTS